MSGKKKAFVKNAADREQVKDASRKEEKHREDELLDLKDILEMPQGRRFPWRLMGHCKTFESIFEPSAKIYYNSGRQDVGHYLMKEIVEAGEHYLLKMMMENKENGLNG